MPGRHGKQRVVRKKSRGKRPRPSPMERMVTDSYFNRNRKEQAILSELVPTQKIEVKRVSGTEKSVAAAAPTKKANGKERAPTVNPTKYEHWTNKPQGKFAQKAGGGAGGAGDMKKKPVEKKKQLSPQEQAEKLLASLASN